MKFYWWRLAFWGVATTLSTEVKIGGIFNSFDDNTNVSNSQWQYLAAFRLAVDEINNKTDGIYDDILPGTELKIVVRHASDRAAASAAIELIENDVEAVISSVHSEVVHELFDDRLMVHFVTQPSEMHRGEDTSYRINIHPSRDHQAHVWQSLLCQIGYTKVSLFYMNNLVGMSMVEDLLDGTYCNIQLASSHQLLPNQIDFRDEIIEAYESLSVVQIVFVEISIAVPLLEQAHAYGLIRYGHQLFLCSKLLTNELWQRMSDDADIIDILRGSLGVKYAPEIALSRSLGQSFQERFRNQPNTLIDGVCDASLDDSSGTHYLYRNADGSRCAGLNHSSISTFDPLVGLIYDSVVSTALAIHNTIQQNTSLTALSLIDSIRDNVSFEGVSGMVDFSEDHGHDDGLSRWVGLPYKAYGFSEAVFMSSNMERAFVWVGVWDDLLRSGMPCDNSYPSCYAPHVYNTKDGSRPLALPRYVSSTLPFVLKIGVMVNTFNEDGSVNDAGVQQLAAFLMAAREINDKTDGIMDDILPLTKIVVSVRSAYDLLTGQEESMKLGMVDFGSGVHAVISGLGFYETLGAYSSQRTFLKVVVNAATNHFLMDNIHIFPYKVQNIHSSTYYGTVLQSLLCNTYNYRKISVFVDNDHQYLDVLAELLSGEFCTFNILSQHVLSEGSIEYKREISEAKKQGARIFVLLTSPDVAGNILHQGNKAGLFGMNRQIFGHADLVDLDLSAIQLGPKDDLPLKSKLFHGFIGVRSHPTYALNYTDAGRAFLDRWKLQPSTIGSMIEGKLECDMTRDDNDYFQLYSSKKSFDTNVVCAGLNFSSFASDGGDIHEYVPHAYDSMVLLARGFHHAMHVLSPPSLNPFVLYDLLTQQVEFEGASGHMKMYYRDDKLIYLGRGARRQGEYFEVVNVVSPLMLNFDFNDDGVLDMNNSTSYVELNPLPELNKLRRFASLNDSSFENYYTNRIGMWEIDMGFEPCDLSLEICSRPVYCTVNNQPVLETPPPVLIKKKSAGYYTVASVLVAITCIFTNMLLRHKSTYVVTQAQSGLLPYVLFGALCISTHTFLSGVPFTTEVCSARNVFFHVGLISFFGPLVISSFRIYHNMWHSSPGTYFTQQGVIVFQACLIVASLIVMLARVVITSEANMKYESEVNNNKEEIFASCSYNSQYFHIFLVVFEAIFLLFGLFVSSLIKDYEDDMGEVRVTYHVLLVMCVASFVVYPAWVLLDVSPDVRLDISVYNIAGVFILCLMILLIQKYNALKQYYSRIIIMQRLPLKENRTTEYRVDSVKMDGESDEFKAMTREEKIIYIRKHIAKWITIFNILQQTNRERYWDTDDSSNEFSGPSESSGGVLQRLFSQEHKSGTFLLRRIAE